MVNIDIYVYWFFFLFCLIDVVGIISFIMVFNVNLNSIFVGSSNFVIVIIVSLGVIINFVISNVIIFILIN